jgi:putative transposase
MITSFKFRLYPFRDQERELESQFDELRFLWNHALEQRQDVWRKEKRSLSFVGQCRDLTRWRTFDGKGIGRVNAQVAQETLARLDDAFKHFFRRVKTGGRPGLPRFKREMTSLTYPQPAESVALTEGREGTKRLHLSKIGDLPIQLHREPPDGALKTCTIEREGDRWFAVLVYEVADPDPVPASLPLSPVGIDLGLTTLAMLSTGEAVEPPKFLRRAEKRLALAQRVVSRRKKGSHNREKARVRLARCHAKVRDQRRDFSHKLTSTWAQRHDLIAFEDMDLRGHMEGKFPKATADAGWGLLRQMSEYKEVRRSGRYMEVPTKGTTQTCSQCQWLADPPLTRKDRTYSCPCGLAMNRDWNAARNILARALAVVPGGTGESTPVEIRPPAHRKGRRVRSLKQESPPTTRVATKGRRGSPLTR